MKKKSRLLSIVAAVLILAVVFSGCSSKGNSASPMVTTEMYDYAEAPMAEEGRGDYGETDTAAVTGASDSQALSAIYNSDYQKIIYSANIDLETKEFVRIMNALTEKTAEMGGYVQDSSVSGREPTQWGDSGRYGNITLRVPAKKLEEFLAFAEGEADVISRSLSSSNITDTYYDAVSRKETLEIQLERLESILTESQTLADVLALETEIARVRGDIESLQGRLNSWDKDVSYSTVYISVRELTNFDRPTAQNQTLGDRVSQASANAWTQAGENLQSFVVWLVRSLPTLILLAVIAVVIWLIVRSIAKKSRIRRAQEMERRMNQGQSGTARSSMPFDVRNDAPDGNDKKE